MNKPRVSIDGTDKSCEVEPESIMFDSLSTQGIDLPHGCLSGSCGACRVDVVSGIENLRPAGVIEKNTIEAVCEEYRQKMGEEFLRGKNIRLSCRAKVCGNVTIKPLGGKNS